MFGVWRTRDGDRLHGGGAFQHERLYVKVTRWRVILAAAAAAAYVVGLFAYLPAEAAAGRSRDAVGSVWRGEVGLEPGFALGWTTHPLRSLVGFAPAGDLRVRGPNTLIDAQASWRRGGLVLESAKGAGSLRLLNAAAPGLPFACDGDMVLTARELAVRGGRDGQGRLRSGPSTCVAGAVTTTPPPLTGMLASDVEGASVTLSAAAVGEVARARLSRDGAVSLTVTPAGAAILPATGAATLEVR